VALCRKRILRCVGNTDIRILVGALLVSRFRLQSQERGSENEPLRQVREADERTLPDIVIYENVPHLRHSQDGRVLDRVR